MSSSRLARPKAAGGAAAAATGALWRTAVVSLVTAGVVAGGTWGLLTPRDAHDEGHAGHAAASVATLSLPDGTLRVDGLVDKQVGHVMAGMSTAQDVPPGMRRLAVNVSLGATGDRPLTYGLRDFTVSGPGVQPVVPVDAQLSGETLQPGTRASGSVSFDVPKESTVLSLRFQGSDAVALPALPALPEVADGEHSEHAGAPAPAPAPASPPVAVDAGADHHDAPAHEH